MAEMPKQIYIVADVEVDTRTNMAHVTGFRKIDDVAPVVHGQWGYRWKIHGDGRRPTELFPCSECGYENTSATNFCPNCGADMRESEEEE